MVGKVVSGVATLSLGHLLVPEDFGRAWYAISIGGLVTGLHVLAGADVLLASPNGFRRIAHSIRTLAISLALIEAVVCLMLAALLQRMQADRAGLVALMAIVAIRPIVDACTLVPLARLRLDFQYSRLSAIDVGVTLVGSALSVAMAWSGFGATALVLPTIAANALRAVMYWAMARRVERAGLSASRARLVRRRFFIAGFGSYVTGILVLVETFVLGLFVSPAELGLFSFAYGLATQISGTVAFQISGALHPIFSHLRNDVPRQVEGMLRACRVIAGTLVPLLVIQACAGGSLFRILWPGRWDEAIPIFMVLSLGQGFMVCQWPAAHVMKSQGRFGGYLKLQLLQVSVTALACVALCWRGASLLAWPLNQFGIDPGRGTPLIVAVGSACLLGIFGPGALYLAARPVRVSRRTIAGIIVRPLLISVPFGVSSAASCEFIIAHVDSRGVAFGLMLLGCGALASAAIVVSLASSRPAREDVARTLSTVGARLPAFRGMLRRTGLPGIKE